MAKDLHYVGDTVNLGFMIDVDDTSLIRMQPTVVTSASVSIYTDAGEIIHDDPVTIIDNVVKYTLDSSMTKHAGDYSALFTIIFNGSEVKTHPIDFTVLPRTVTKNSKSRKVSKLSNNSSENEVEAAVDGDLRLARRSGMGAKQARQSLLQEAQQATGRRHRRD